MNRSPRPPDAAGECGALPTCSSPSPSATGRTKGVAPQVLTLLPLRCSAPFRHHHAILQIAPASRGSARRARLCCAHPGPGRRARRAGSRPRPPRFRPDRLGQDRGLRPRHGGAAHRRRPAGAVARAARPDRRADPRARAPGQPRARMALRQIGRPDRDLRRRHGPRQGAAACPTALRSSSARPVGFATISSVRLDLSALASSSSTKPTRCSTLAFARTSRRSSTPLHPRAGPCSFQPPCPSRSSPSPAASSATRCASRPSIRIAATVTLPTRRSPSRPPRSSMP